MEQFEQFYWWHKGKTHMLTMLLDKFVSEQNGELNILEVGCGTGATLQALKPWGTINGVDIEQQAVNYCKSKGFENVECKDIFDLDSHYSNKYDVVVCLDVLEHIQNDVGAMKKIRGVLKNSGVAIISVPAHKFLWSEHDEALHHKRRYHTTELLQKLKDANFEILKYTYFVFVLFFPILLFRTINTFFRKHAYPTDSYFVFPRKINDFFIKVLDAEIAFVKRFRLPVGTTLIAVVQKND